VKLMFVMIAGCGRLGAGLAGVLASRGNDLVVVSETIDPKWLGPDFDGLTVVGDPADADVLREAGIEKADLFVAATSDDAVNSMAAQVAATVFRVPLAVARITDPSRERFYRAMGIRTVCPTSTGINQILDAIQGSDYEALSGSIDPCLAGVVPPSEWVGRKLGELRPPRGRRIVGIERDGIVSPPKQSLPVKKDDVLLLRKNMQKRREP
jgi:trk system potassium uptake protein